MELGAGAGDAEKLGRTEGLHILGVSMDIISGLVG